MTKPTKGVATTHPDYDRLLPYWQDCRNAASGQRAMHAAGERYLDKLVDETPTQYKARLKRSNFFNGTWRTIAGLKGMAFRVDPTQTLPKAIEALTKDITLSGVSLGSLSSNVVEEILEVGRIGIMVDHPPRSESVTPITVALAEQMGLRPTIQFYRAESIINWRYRKAGNAWVLALVVLCEEAEIGGDEFGHECEKRYRVLDLDDAGQYRQRVYRRKDDKDELIEGPTYPTINNAPLTYIPFIMVGATGKGDAIDEPPLIDLVDANIALYQVNSDRRHGLHFTGLPTAVVSGYQPENATDKLFIGSTQAWVFPDPNAKASYLEFTGQGLQPSKDMSLELKQEMALLGARMLADESKQAETLGGTQIKHQGENSMLGEIVGHASDALEWALGIFAQWTGASGEIVYQINRKFLPAPMGPQELTALVASWQSGAISDGDLFKNLQEGEIIAAGKTLEEHQAERDLAGPVAPAPTPKPAEAA